MWIFWTRRPAWLWPATFSFLAACGPAHGPARVEVLQWDETRGSYTLAPETLETLADAETMTGSAATAVGGLRLAIDASGDVGTPEKGGPVHLQFAERDHVLWPVDYDSLALATLYHDIERTRSYAQARGLGNDIDGVRFSYNTRITLAGQSGILADNAAWIGFLDLFIFPPFARITDIPLTMNQGVVSHEYGHAIFGSQVYPQGPDYIVRWCPLDPMTNLYTCPHPQAYAMVGIVEEGFADSWALAVTGDPLFLERSIPSATARRVDPFDATRHCADQGALDGDVKRYGLEPAIWAARKYQYGTVWAAALWRAGKEPGTSHDLVMDALFASYAKDPAGSLRALIEGDSDGSRYGQFAEIAARIIQGAGDPATRDALCAALQDRFFLDLSSICIAGSFGECGG